MFPVTEWPVTECLLYLNGPPIPFEYQTPILSGIQVFGIQVGIQVLGIQVFVIEMVTVLKRRILKSFLLQNVDG